MFNAVLSGATIDISVKYEIESDFEVFFIQMLHNILEVAI